MVDKQLQGFLDDTSALNPFQSSFCPGHRTVTVLFTLMDDLHRQLDRGGSALLILLDLIAALDTVDHELLTHHLTDAGVCGGASQWLSSFLHGQEQREVLGEDVTSTQLLLYRVPQGTLLSPMLFNNYMHPLSHLAQRFGLRGHWYLLLDGNMATTLQNLAKGLEAMWDD